MKANVVPVATGEAWVGSGVRSSQSVIIELIEEAQKELLLTVYILTNTALVDEISAALDRGVGVTVYLYDDGNNMIKTDAVRAIYDLCEEYPYLSVKKVKNRVLHAKIIVADGRKVLAGSANMTHSAMVSNYELGFLVDDARIAGNIIELIRKVGE